MIIIFWICVVFCFFYVIWFIIAFIAYLAECSRVPFDLSEAESEIVAGFTTEYSSIYFSVLILTEYINVIIGSVIIIILYNLTMFIINTFLYFIILFRCTFVRLKFDELLSISWNTFLLISFGLLLISIFNNNSFCQPNPRPQANANTVAVFFEGRHDSEDLKSINAGTSGTQNKSTDEIIEDMKLAGYIYEVSVTCDASIVNGGDRVDVLLQGSTDGCDGIYDFLGKLGYILLGAEYKKK